MAIGIIEKLEVVQVQHRDGERRAETLRPISLLLETLMERPVVQQSCQRVEIGTLQCFAQKLFTFCFEYLSFADFRL